SEAQYRALFEENPLPMWIVDLSSGRFLEVNEAALRQYGYRREEFMALTASDLVPVSAAAALRHDLARPCLDGASPKVWQHRRKDGTLVEVEIAALDLKFRNSAGRL